MTAGTTTGTRVRARRRFLSFFPDGFRDDVYVETERMYKWAAHREWVGAFGAGQFEALLRANQFAEIARRALRIDPTIAMRAE